MIMDYRELRKLKVQLLEKETKTNEEIQLLIELQSLSQIIDKLNFSLSMSSKVCKTCGRAL